MRLLKCVAATTLITACLAIGSSASASTSQLVNVDESLDISNVLISVENGVAILAGTVSGTFDKAKVELAAAKMDGVEKLYSYLEVAE